MSALIGRLIECNDRLCGTIEIINFALRILNSCAFVESETSLSCQQTKLIFNLPAIPSDFNKEYINKS